ncbi:hypothetical protein LTR91_007120 [Friedmanniomyces endolithicus]|uniref:Uncharacterized protein n=1 Tax=Friedmanniomyces endolithicus TaxID=329885 RepID=A0AAN6KQU2_9PEZI|nr:hypothetical protein LTR91_007120 [Friedmanniomyces endolithicus]KAK1007051.1 hypothetical protein LTS01_002743 [Friedmanniomyces endolithicus]KAK1027495.1 hypothetical protein LTS16_021431 [Friedmanniomyces endolithicus]
MAAVASGTWAYAVPMDETNGYAPPQRTDTLQSQSSNTAASREARTTSQRRPSDFNIQSDSEATSGTRKASLRASNASAGRKRSRNALKEKRDAVPETSADDSAWIHRDKLAQIEIQEMEEAGLHVRQPRRSSSTGPVASARTSRSASQPGAGRAVSKDRQGEGAEEQDGPLFANFDDYQRKRVSTIPAADEEELEHERTFDPTVDSELRTPEEVHAAQHVSKQLRPSTSRIPISKASPVPVPHQVVERDSPLPRSRNGSGAWSGAWDDQQYARHARSGSAGSQNLLDEVEGHQAPASRPTSSYLQNVNEKSPPKARTSGMAASTSGGRKVSGTTNAATRPLSSHANKPRTSSLANKRPGSSSGPVHGHKSRPSTAHAPEGEAPWIASMYKPDPRLPPDQQLLPTHAKRLQQEQWEREGKTGTPYDRDFNLLNDTQMEQKPASVPKLETNQVYGNLSPKGSPRLEKPFTAASDKPWPLSPHKSDTKSETGSVRPGTSGGYRTTPTIAATPPIQRPPVVPSTMANDRHPFTLPPTNTRPFTIAMDNTTIALLVTLSAILSLLALSVSSWIAAPEFEALLFPANQRVLDCSPETVTAAFVAVGGSETPSRPVFTLIEPVTLFSAAPSSPVASPADSAAPALVAGVPETLTIAGPVTMFSFAPSAAVSTTPTTTISAPPAPAVLPPSAPPTGVSAYIAEALRVSRRQIASLYTQLQDSERKRAELSARLDSLRTPQYGDSGTQTVSGAFDTVLSPAQTARAEARYARAMQQADAATAREVAVQQQLREAQLPAARVEMRSSATQTAPRQALRADAETQTNGTERVFSAARVAAAETTHAVVQKQAAEATAQVAELQTAMQDQADAATALVAELQAAARKYAGEAEARVAELEAALEAQAEEARAKVSELQKAFNAQADAALEADIRAAIEESTAADTTTTAAQVAEPETAAPVAVPAPQPSDLLSRTCGQGHVYLAQYGECPLCAAPLPADNDDDFS